MNQLTVAIMQPYFYPYIGYFHLINAVNKFIVFDDVNFIKKGWINRNQILLNGISHLFTLSIKEISQNKKINESFIFEPNDSKFKVLNLIRNAYKEAPFFIENIDLLESLILSSEENIAIYNLKNLSGLSSYLGMTTEFQLSSKVPHDMGAKGQEKILSILTSLEANAYVNAINGQALYSADDFVKKKISLNFIKSMPIAYKQGKNPFVPNLSIIDVLMYAGKQRTQDFIKDFTLT